MIFFKPKNMPLSFASQNFILKCLSTFEQAQTNITNESGLKKGYRSIYHDYETSYITVWEKI